MVSAYLVTKKDKWQKKSKHIQSRNLRRKIKSYFRIIRDAFYDLVAELNPFIAMYSFENHKNCL